MNENFWKSCWSKDQIKVMLLEQFDFFWARGVGCSASNLSKSRLQRLW
jgi:hypothetical protein